MYAGTLMDSLPVRRGGPLAGWRGRRLPMIPILAVTLLAAPRPTDSTLSILEPAGAKCEWHRVDPLLKDALTLATFDVPCQGGEISWSHERDHAVFFFPDPASA